MTGSSNNDAFMVWSLMEKRFLSAILAQIVEDVPQFNLDRLQSRLHDFQESLSPNTDDREFNGQVRLGLDFLGEFVEIVEDVAKDSSGSVRYRQPRVSRHRRR
jgi:hypothetical protein